MMYDHVVKQNGIYYQAGEDVPEYEESEKIKQTEQFERQEGTENLLPFEPKEYKKTDIMKMPKSELISLAIELGIEDAQEDNGENLKRKIIGYFGL